jgi:hypothetical protein
MAYESQLQEHSTYKRKLSSDWEPLFEYIQFLSHPVHERPRWERSRENGLVNSSHDLKIPIVTDRAQRNSWKSLKIHELIIFELELIYNG